MRVSIAGFALLIAVFSGSGCATLVRGTEANIIISCNVPQADVRLNGEPIDGRGFEYRLDRWQTYTIEASAPGYESTSVTLERSASVTGIVCTFGNAIFGIFGVVGLIVDGTSGAWVELEPGDVYLNLERSAIKPDARDTIVRAGEEDSVVGLPLDETAPATGPPTKNDLAPTQEAEPVQPRRLPGSVVR